MSKEAKKRHFDEKDVGLLEDILDFVPDLDVVAYAAKIARQRLGYPLESHADLLPLFDERKSGRFKNREVTFDQAVRFLPKEFFPIVSERDFVGKLLIAFQKGTLLHMQEQVEQGKASKVGPGEEISLLPSPRSPMPGDFPAEN